MALFSPFGLTRKVFLSTIDKIDNDKIKIEEIRMDDSPKCIPREELNIDKEWIQKEFLMIDNDKMNEFKKQELNMPRLNKTFIFNNSEKDFDNFNHNYDKKRYQKLLNRSLDLSKIRKENEKLSFNEKLSLLNQNLNKISMHNELNQTIKLYKKYSIAFQEMDKQVDEIKQIIKNSPY